MLQGVNLCWKKSQVSLEGVESCQAPHHASVNIPKYNVLTSQNVGLFSLEPIDIWPQQFYIGTSSQSLRTHSEISKQIRPACNWTSVLPYID